MKKILLDIDGCLANFYTSFASFLNNNYDTYLDLELEPKSYEFGKWKHGVDSIDIDKAFNKWVVSGGFKSMPIYPGALEFYNKLAKKYDIYITTARLFGNFNPNLVNKIKDDTINWFKAHSFNCTHLYFEHDKVAFCKNNRIDVMIEDKLSTAQEGSRNGILTILIDRGWNKGRGVNRLFVHRVYSYDKALKALEDLG